MTPVFKNRGEEHDWYEARARERANAEVANLSGEALMERWQQAQEAYRYHGPTHDAVGLVMACYERAKALGLAR